VDGRSGETASAFAQRPTGGSSYAWGDDGFLKWRRRRRGCECARVVEVPIGGKLATKPAPRVEQCFGDGVAAGPELLGDRVERDAFEHQGHEHPPLTSGELLLHDAPNGPEQLTPLGRLVRVRVAPVRERLPTSMTAMT
jgi:hypothetical protein